MTNPDRYTDTIDRKIRVVVYSYCDDRSSLTAEDAEDCLQEARMVVWRWLVDHPTEELGEGLTRLLADQACRDFERSSRKHRKVEYLEDWYDAPDKEQYAAAEYQAMLGNILGKVVNSDQEAAVALLVIHAGCTIRQAGERLGLSTTSVFRTVTTLRKRAEALGLRPGGQE